MSPVGAPKFTPAIKRFNRRYLPIADAIASVNIDQEAREAVAEEVAHAITAAGARDFPDFRHDTFVLLASDPLVPCAGTRDGPCPHGRVMRIGMHLSSAPDGRSLAWEQRAPHGRIRCVSCGAAEFIPGFSES
jgi:hypothetical protein